MPDAAPKIALILSGGGARAAYQAGVARAIAEMVPSGNYSPFAIICGTSAGAINAASLAAGARDFRAAAQHRTTPGDAADPPSLAQIGSHVLASIFTDALGTDLEKVRLVNIAVRQIDPARLGSRPMPLRDIAMLVLTPSLPLENLAHDYRDNLPRSLRFALRGIGATREGGEGLLSYLLFDRAFCSTLIELGYRAAQEKQAELTKLLN